MVNVYCYYCNTTVGTASTTFYGFNACINCFGNGVSSSNFAQKIKQLYQFQEKVLVSDLKTQNSSLESRIKDMSDRYEKDSLKIYQIFSSKKLFDFTKQYVQFMVNLKESDLNICQTMRKTSQTILRQIQQFSIKVISREVKSLVADIQKSKEANSIDIHKVEEVRIYIQEKLTEVVKQIVDKDGNNKLFNKEQMKMVIDVLNGKIDAMNKNNTAYSALAKQGERMMMLEVGKGVQRKVNQINQ